MFSRFDRPLGVAVAIALLGATGCSPPPAQKMTALAACSPEHKGKRVEIGGQFGGGESTITISNGRASLRFDQGLETPNDLYVELEVGDGKNQLAPLARSFTASELRFRLDDNRQVGVRQPIVIRGILSAVTALPEETVTSGRHPYVCTVTVDTLLREDRANP